MPITVTQKEHIGNLLFLKPRYGWGWHGTDDKTLIDYALIDAAGGCHIRVQRFFSWRGNVRGVIGTVEEPGHLFDSLWIVCAEMLQGEHDFTTRLCTRYDLELGTSAPDDADWPLMTIDRRYAGYGILAASAGHIES